MLRKLLLSLVLVWLSAAATAQTFPSKQITIIVGVAPGGTLDALARQVALGLTTSLKQTVIVENVTGAGGLVGFQRLLKAEPDGHTLNFSNQSLLIIPHLYPKGNFDPLLDLTPVGTVATVPMVMAVSNASGIKDLGKLLTMVADASPIRRKVTIDDVGNMAAFLLSDLASGVTAEITFVDGGYNKTMGVLTE